MPHTNDYFIQLKRTNTYFLLSLSVLSLVAVLLLEGQITARVNVDIDRLLQGIAVVISLVTVFAGFQSFKKRILAVRRSGDAVSLRLKQYRNACVGWWLTLFLPALIYLAFFVATANYAFLVLAIFNCGTIFLFRPRKENVLLLLNLTEEDIS